MRAPAVDLSSQLQIHNLRAGRTAPACTACRRRLLPGEILHVFEEDKALCTLCASRLPAAARTPLRSERIHVGQRHLPVVPRAA